MAKSLVDKYEQILAQDPASTAFVELAKALIDKDDHARAIDVCRQGLAHHPQSVVARVLWGKALINLGRPAEAMGQFDQAIAIDRENPHAYNLISEVLLHKRLYRSALPLLRKAVVLQPNDGRLRSWLEQTQAALNGGPAPVLTGNEASNGAEHSEAFGGSNGVEHTGDAFTAPAPQIPIDDPFAAMPAAERNGASLHPEIPVLTPASTNGVSASASYAAGLPGPAEQPAFPTPPAPPPPPKRNSGTGLLADLPDEEELAPAPEAPKVEIPTHHVEAIAQNYEKELRAKLAETTEKKKKTFIARHWVKLAAATVGLVAVVVGGLIYARTVTVNRGSIQDALVEAKKSVALDTRAGYATAVEALGRAVRMDEGSVEAWALSGYAHALAFAEHGRKDADRAAAEAALAKPGVKEQFASLMVAARWYLTDPASRDERDKDIVAGTSPDAELNELAGRILLARRDHKAALQRFQTALGKQPNNVRVLVALGDYYRSSGDYRKALEFYATAEEISPAQPLRVLGMAESRLELGLDLPAALAAVEGLAEDVLPEELKVRRALARGRLLTATGEPAKAVEVLTDASARFPSAALPLHMALGSAQRRAGRMADAERSFEAVLKLEASNEEARDLLGRVLIERDRARDAVTRIAADPGSRKVSLMRGVAYSRMKDWKKARAEFARTQVKGRFPVEAVTHLAIADAAQARGAKAQAVLMKILALSKKKPRGEILVALGELHLANGELDKAKTLLGQAAKEPEDVEAACAYGRLLLRTGATEAALEPLQRAASRNDSHLEAHEALARAYVELGKTEEALDAVGAVAQTGGTSGGLERARALALYLSNRTEDADKAIAQATRLEPRSADGWRIRGVVDFARGDGRAGMQSLQRANGLDPKDAETFCAIGQAFLRQGNEAHARKAFEAALSSKSDVPCGRVGAIYAKLPSGSKLAVKELEEVAGSGAAVWDRAFAHAARARVLLALGKLDDARAAADEAVKMGGWSGLAQLALGLVAAKQKDAQVAREALERAVALDPLNGAARLALGDLLAKGSDEDQGKAVEQYQAFLQIGGERNEEDRVERAVNTLKKRLAAR
jgi:tetratricopeptide (TPR) repeat protein